MEVIRWAILGAGDVCEVKSGPGFYNAPGSALVAISKRRAEEAEDFARRHGVARWYTDPEALIADNEVDAIYVATPPHLHRRFGEEALLAGKPVLVEKPMALTGADCDAMVDVSARTGRPLWVAYYRRGLDKFRAIRAAINAGTIGEPRSLSIEFSRPRQLFAPKSGALPWRVDPAVAGGGIIFDLAGHMVDLLDWFLGPIHSVAAHPVNRGGEYAAEDLVAATFLVGHERPVVGSALWDFSGTEPVDRTVIRGSKGAIEYSTFDDSSAKLYSGGAVSLMERYPFPKHVHQPLIELINEELRGGDPAPTAGVVGARSSRVLDALVAPYYACRHYSGTAGRSG